MDDDQFVPLEVALGPYPGPIGWLQFLRVSYIINNAIARDRGWPPFRPDLNGGDMVAAFQELPDSP